jgi:hypothetical protein
LGEVGWKAAVVGGLGWEGATALMRMRFWLVGGRMLMVIVECWFAGSRIGRGGGGVGEGRGDKTKATLRKQLGDRSGTWSWSSSKNCFCFPILRLRNVAP